MARQTLAKPLMDELAPDSSASSARKTRVDFTRALRKGCVCPCLISTVHSSFRLHNGTPTQVCSLTYASPISVSSSELELSSQRNEVTQQLPEAPKIDLHWISQPCADLTSEAGTPPVTAQDGEQSPSMPPVTSMTSFSDPAYDYFQKPYKRPPGRRAPVILKYGLVSQNHSSFNHNSFMDPVYDFMEGHYERPRGRKGRRT